MKFEYFLGNFKKVKRKKQKSLRGPIGKRKLNERPMRGIWGGENTVLEESKRREGAEENGSRQTLTGGNE